MPHDMWIPGKVPKAQKQENEKKDKRGGTEKLYLDTDLFDLFDLFNLY